MSMEQFNSWYTVVQEVAKSIESITGRPVIVDEVRGVKCSLYGPNRFCWFTFQKTKPKPFRWVVKERWADSDVIAQVLVEYWGKYIDGDPTVGWYTETTEQERRQIARLLAKVCESRHR